MFDDASWARTPDTHDTDPDHAPAAGDAGTLLAAIGLSSRAICEVLGHPAGAGAGG